MATLVREGLNVTGMSSTIYCAGQSRVGINLSGTWAGTVKFYASQDGAFFQPVFATPFASGTAVLSATANGTFYIDSINYVAVKAIFTRTSGTALVALSASIDSSYQDAFLAASSLFVNTTASGATNTTTIAAQANRAWRLRDLIITVDTTPTWASSPNWKVTDGGSTILWAGDLSAAAQQTRILLPLPASNVPGIVDGGLVNTIGNSMTIVVASGGGSVKTNVDAALSAA